MYFTTNMTNLKIDLKQREHLASFIENAKREEKRNLEEQSGVTEESITQVIAKQKGAGPLLKKDAELLKQIEELKLQRKDNEVKLAELGFDFNGSRLSVRWDARALRDEVAAKLEEARRPIEKSLKKYDLAFAKTWTAVSGEELQKVVEGLI